MTRPKVTGTLAKKLFDRIADEAREGRQEAVNGLYLMLGDDTKAAIENQRSIIERLDLIEQAMSKMSNLQIYQAVKLLEEETK